MGEGWARGGLITSFNIYISHVKNIHRKKNILCGPAFGISRGIDETEQFNNVAFMDDITTLAQDNEGAQNLLNATQEFEVWRSPRTF